MEAGLFSDEEAPQVSWPESLHQIDSAKVTLLIGPEGGFSDNERRLLLEQENVTRLSLGPRILRAETAAIAALTLVQALKGDWTKDQG